MRVVIRQILIDFSVIFYFAENCSCTAKEKSAQLPHSPPLDPPHGLFAEFARFALCLRTQLADSVLGLLDAFAFLG